MTDKTITSETPLAELDLLTDVQQKDLAAYWITTVGQLLSRMGTAEGRTALADAIGAAAGEIEQLRARCLALLPEQDRPRYEQPAPVLPRPGMGLILDPKKLKKGGREQ